MIAAHLPGPFAALVALVACTGREAPRQAAAPPAEAPAEAAPVAAPQPPRLVVEPRTVAFDAISDTLRLSLPSGTACRSANEAVAAVDITGLVRSAGNGDTHLRCWLGRSQRVVPVQVVQAVARVGIVAEPPGLSLEKGGDSVRLRLAGVDRMGTSVEMGRPVWESLQPEVVRVDAATGLAQGVADSGVARIVAQLDRYTDTVTIEVGRKPTAAPLARVTSATAASRIRSAALRGARQPSAALSRQRGVAAPPATGGAAAAGTPTASRPGMALIGARELRPSDSLAFQDPAAQAAGRGWTLTPSLRVVIADHGLSEAGSLERNSGMLLGAGADVAGLGWLRLGVTLLTGSLSAQTTAARDQKVTLGRLDVGIAAAPWLTLSTGAESRLYSALGDVRWLSVRAGGQVRFAFGGTPLSGLLGVHILPLVSRGSGNVSPSLGLNTTVGLLLERGRLASSLRYVVERYTYPSSTGREEHFSSLELRFGLAFSR